MSRWTALRIGLLIAAGLSFGFVPCAAASPIVVEGDFGRSQYRPHQQIGNLPAGTTFDAWNATWIEDNGGWTGDVNTYPIIIDHVADGVWNGGFVQGQVPQDIDRVDAYVNNSAAFFAFRDSDNFRVNGIRIDAAWDGVRFNPRREQAGVSILEHSWITRVRDDGVDNPRLQSMTVRDSLIEAFVPISLDPGANYDGPDQSDKTVTIEDALLRSLTYKHRGEVQSGTFIKTHDAMPQLVIKNTIFAFDDLGIPMRNRMGRAWNKTIVSENNTLLWLSDEPFPEAFPDPPAGFTIYTGDEARALWDAERETWIARHPHVVPEPSGAALFGVGGLLLLSRRRRRLR